MIKGIERAIPMLRFKLRTVEVRLHGVRQDSPPKMLSIDYEPCSRTPGFEAVHDVHVSSLSTTSVGLTAHLIIPDELRGDGLPDRGLERPFDIAHKATQIGRGEGRVPRFADRAARCRRAPGHGRSCEIDAPCPRSRWLMSHHEREV